MIGVVDVGGGTRGAYGAGVFDYCLENGISFDYLVGVSAGSANEASFLAGQKGRNFRFYTDYSFRGMYMGLPSLFKTGNYLNLEYIYGDGLSNSCGEDPLDFETIRESGKTFEIVTTDARTGETVYYSSQSMSEDDYGAIKGSSCVPVVSKPYAWKGRLLFDGGLSDPIPFRRAFEKGCDKVLVILTRPRDFRRNPKKDAKFARLIHHRYPNAAKALSNRANIYNRQLEEALELEDQGKVLVIAPYSIAGMETLTKDRNKVEWLYNLGKEDAKGIQAFVEN